MLLNLVRVVWTLSAVSSVAGSHILVSTITSTRNVCPATTVFTTTTVTRSSALLPTSTPTGAFVINIFQLNAAAYQKRQDYTASFLMANGNTTTNSSYATRYSIVNGQLVTSDGRTVSTSWGVESQAFSANRTVGPISTTFAFDASISSLTWSNANFTNGTAQFYKTPAGLLDNAQILVKFIGPMEPNRGWSPISLIAIPLGVVQISGDGLSPYSSQAQTNSAMSSTMAGYNNVNPSVSSDAPPSNLDTSLASSTTQVSADGLSTSSTGGYDYNYPTSSSNGMSSASLLASTSSMPTGYDGGETSSSQSPSISGSPRTVSPNGRCAGNTGYTCHGSAFGDCCSSFGYCGSSDSFCGMDCNPAFGSCASGGGYSSVSALSSFMMLSSTPMASSMSMSMSMSVSSSPVSMSMSTPRSSTTLITSSASGPSSMSVPTSIMSSSVSSSRSASTATPSLQSSPPPINTPSTATPSVYSSSSSSRTPLSSSSPTATLSSAPVSLALSSSSAISSLRASTVLTSSSAPSVPSSSSTPSINSVSSTTGATSGSTAPAPKATVGIYRYIGCYLDNGGGRALSDQMDGGFTGGTTLEKCAAICQLRNYQYFGVEFAYQCFCGNTLNKGPISGTDSFTCSDPRYACTGDRTEQCGGASTISVYNRTDGFASSLVSSMSSSSSPVSIAVPPSSSISTSISSRVSVTTTSSAVNTPLSSTSSSSRVTTASLSSLVSSMPASSYVPPASSSCVPATTPEVVRLSSPTPVVNAYTAGRADADADDENGVVAPGFNMSIGSASRSEIIVSINGVMYFDFAPDSDYQNDPLPTTSIDPNAVAPYWYDLFISQGTNQGVFYQVSGGTLTIEWLASSYNEVNFIWHFQAIYSSAMPGVWTFRYFRIDDCGDSATVGFQSDTGSRQWSYNAPGSVYNGLQLQFNTLQNTVTPSTLTP